jgi:valyl-tRNA synthetase
MMMLGIHLADAPPFNKVYLHGLVKDPYGKRMSKTKGNVVDPLEAIDSAGADALRFALLNGTSPGNDQKFSSERLEDGRNFANKLWNATRFVLGARPASIDADRASRREAPDPERLGPAEHWIRAGARDAVASVDRGFEDDNYGEVSRLLYEAIWSRFCDWGIELAKVRLGDASLPDADRAATWWTLVEALDTYLRLLHPIMPFVTEALWAVLPHAADDPQLLIVARWPSAGATSKSNATTEAPVVDEVIELVSAIRTARATAGVPAAAWLPIDIFVPGSHAAVVDALAAAIERLARVRPIARAASREALDGAPAGSLGVVAGKLEARIHASTQPDAADRARVEKELAQAEAALAATRGRLGDATFVERAPASIVDATRSREAELAERVDRLRASLG